MPWEGKNLVNLSSPALAMADQRMHVHFMFFDLEDVHGCETVTLPINGSSGP